MTSSEANAKYVQASRLAIMGYCETQAWFREHRGDLATLQQTKRRAEGMVEHNRFHELVTVEHNKQRARDRRCFIATAVYGTDDARTGALRDFRDRALMPYRMGRLAVRLYYATSPAIALVLDRIPVLKGVVRPLLDAVVRRVSL